MRSEAGMMPIKQIILHQGRDKRSDVRLDAACAIAERYGSHIIGVFVSAPADDQARKVFDTRLSEKGLTGEWHEFEDGEVDVVTKASRFGDLTIVGQFDPDDENSSSRLTDHVVLGAVGPVLILPYAGTFPTLGERVMIAWDGGTAAARAVQNALPLIQNANKVIVYTVESADRTNPDQFDIGAYLARHGVQLEVSLGTVGSESDAVASSLQTVGGFGFQERGAWTYTRHQALAEIGTGDAILSAVSDHSIDLLVMGAYGHMRLWEMLFGGVTRQILTSMTVPVLMSN